MKIKDLETAMKLAKITNRPLEDFYDGPIESESSEQIIEEQVEEETDECEVESISDIPEVRNPNKTNLSNENIRPPRDSSKDDAYIQQYGGKMSDNGKLICDTKQMTKKEYLAETKGLDEQDILAHPLLYLMFRSEGQTEGHFVQWLSRFSKE